MNTKCTQRCITNTEIIIVVGRTKSGEPFRPRNWTCRLADQIAQHDPGKQVATRYRPCLIPTLHNGIPTLHNGIPSLRMATSLQACEDHKHMYDVVMQFARWADLEVVKGIAPQRLCGVPV